MLRLEKIVGIYYIISHGTFCCECAVNLLRGGECYFILFALLIVNCELLLYHLSLNLGQIHPKIAIIIC